MQDSRINYVVVGAFVAAMLVAFVVVASVLAGRTGATDSYYTVYNNVGGIKYGTIVFYEGFQVGHVESIEPIQKGRQLTFRVNMEITHGWQIPTDSVARALISGLLSAVAIDIKGGKAEALLPPGAEMKGQGPGNLFATLADIGAEFGDLSTNSIKPLLENVNVLVKQLSASTADNLPVILANLNKLSGSVERSAAVIEKGFLKPENVQHMDAIVANVDQVTANLNQLSAGLEETRKLLNESVARVNKVVDNNSGNVDEAMRNLRYTTDTIARNVDDIAHNAAATARNMAEFSRSIRENPGLLLGGAAPEDPVKPKTGGGK
ncbi:MAG: MlaD family protein [Rhodospirillaceae bacterium]|nr:MlaD family protein [Rhodospirillaceae bacterium]